MFKATTGCNGDKKGIKFLASSQIVKQNSQILAINGVRGLGSERTPLPDFSGSTPGHHSFLVKLNHLLSSY